MRNGNDTASGSREDRGNAILSTLPLVAPRVVELPLRQQRRVAVAADLPIAAVGADTDDDRTRAIRFVSAHVDTHAGGDQARALAGLLRQWGGGAPIFVGSDLNALFGRFDSRTRAMGAAVRRRDCGGRSYLHVLSLDQVFTDLDGWVRSCRVLSDRFGSDHAPLVAELTVP
jgi:endonuclease/exonuclease/phosphatase family metal-dependent hydrolase